MLTAQVGVRASADLTLPPDLPEVVRGMNRRLARDTALRIRENASGGPGARYLNARTGATARSAYATVTPGGYVAGARGPGVESNEEGAVIQAKGGGWLTFRLFRPEDTARPTGRWVRVRSVTIRPKHFVRDAVLGTLAHADEALAETLEGLGW